MVYAEHNLYTCSQDTQEKIRKTIEEQGLNRVVVASCTPRTHEPLFQDTLRQAGLNPHLFEMANIREQDSWVHKGKPEVATEKARQLGQLIRSGASELHMAMPNLREKKNFRLVTEHIKEINTIENNGDRILREALVEIVANKDDIFNLIRWKEIYEMLEETTDTMEDVADVLQRVVIKNG